MRLAVAIFFLLASTCVFSQTAPPGADMVGSDRALHRGDQGSIITNSPDINAQIGGYEGETTGDVVTPGIQTSGTDNRTNLQNASEAGQSTQTGATAARRGAAELSAQAHGNLSGDNGSVWDANTVRKSNIVGTGATTHGQTNGHAAAKAKP
ncbi:MAG TPA: hypothetical protein VKW78_06740 [Terriglobales bacterium]|nr:hypothetical protein [Terriglobales bacterium]